MIVSGRYQFESLHMVERKLLSKGEKMASFG